MTKQPDYYAILGLPRDADAVEIRRAYHHAARSLHPDVNNDPGANDKFILIQSAYEVLVDPERRTAYDQATQGIASLLPGIAVELIYSRPSLITLEEPQLIYCLVDIKPPENRAEFSMPKLNLSVVLDRSTSMRGDRLDTVKSAAIEMLRLLRPSDYFSLVTFSDRAEVIFTSRAHLSHAKMLSAIHRIHASGATEIYQGFSTGYHEVRRQLRQSAINHIMLITDGRTYGDEQACLQLADQAATEGIGISCLGIGHDWNDKFLDKLSSTTGGSSLYVSPSSDIKQLFLNIFRSLENTYAKEVRINLDMNEAVKLRDVFRLSPEPGALGLQSPMQCGHVPESEPLTLLFEFEIPPLCAEHPSYQLASGMLHYQLPEAEYPLRTERIQFVRPIETSSHPGPAPNRLQYALSRLSLYRMQELANQELAEGQVEDATRHFRYLATQLLNSGEDELSQAVLREAENLKKGSQISSAGRKQIKYGTRALVLPVPVTDTGSPPTSSSEGGLP